jgi:hypothetical protein
MLKKGSTLVAFGSPRASGMVIKPIVASSSLTAIQVSRVSSFIRLLSMLKALSHSSLDNPPLAKGRRFLPDSESPSVGSCCWPIRAGLTSQAMRASPALGYSTNLVFHCKNSGYRSCRESIEQCIRSLHPRPEGRGFPRITGKRPPHRQVRGHFAAGRTCLVESAQHRSQPVSHQGMKSKSLIRRTPC